MINHNLENRFIITVSECIDILEESFPDLIHDSHKTRGKE